GYEYERAENDKPEPHVALFVTAACERKAVCIASAIGSCAHAIVSWLARPPSLQIGNAFVSPRRLGRRRRARPEICSPTDERSVRGTTHHPDQRHLRANR